MRFILAALLLTSAGSGGVLGQQPAAAKRAAAKKIAAAHPDIGQENGDCLSCHRDMNAEIVADWESSKHGSRMVPCATCHGSVGPSFVRKPGAAKCVACHSEQVSTLRTSLMKGKDCWSCHAPHRLNPHKSIWKTGGAQ
jgi:hypothetical protein